MDAHYLEYITKFSQFCIGIPLLVGLFFFRRLNRSQRLLFLLVLASCIVETIASMMTAYKFSNNLYVYNSYTIINLNIVFLIYLALFKPRTKSVLTGFLILANGFALLNAIFLQPFNTFNSNTLVLVSVILLIMALSYFYRLMTDVKFHKLERDPLFWLSAGIIMYYSSATVLFIYSNHVIAYDPNDPNSELLFLASWGLNSIFNLILVTAYTITLWVKALK